MSELQQRCYFGCRIKQRVAEGTPAFFVFYARVSDVKQWVGFRRVKDYPEGTQRALRPLRQRGVTRFLEAEDINTIPNNILLAFETKTQFKSCDDKLAESLKPLDTAQHPRTKGKAKDSRKILCDTHNSCNSQLEWGFLTFEFKPDLPQHERPALVVDGQHRLFGMTAFEKEDLPILIVSMINADLSEQAFQFVVINNKAVKVPAENVKSILAGFDDNALQERLSKAGVPYKQEEIALLRDINDLKDSPFQNLLLWSHNRAPAAEEKFLVPTTAVTQAIRFIEAVFVNLQNDEDSLVEFFFAVWNAVRKTYPEMWGKHETFMKKVAINALNEFLVERLKFAWEMNVLDDIFDRSEVEKQVFNILKRIPAHFWQLEWLIQIQDNANVRRMIKEDLTTMLDNAKLGRQWKDGLQLPKSVEITDE